MSYRFSALSILLAAACAYAPTASAENGEAGLGFHGVGGALGLVSPEGPAGMAIGLEGHVDLGAPLTSAPELHFMPALSWWSKDGFTEIGFWADAVYMLAMSDPDAIQFFFGGGLGLFFSSFDFGPGIDGSSTDLGFHLNGGAAKKMGDTLTAFGRLRIKFDGVDTVSFQAGARVGIGG